MISLILAVYIFQRTQLKFDQYRKNDGSFTETPKQVSDVATLLRFKFGEFIASPSNQHRSLRKFEMITKDRLVLKSLSFFIFFFANKNILTLTILAHENYESPLLPF